MKVKRRVLTVLAIVVLWAASGLRGDATAASAQPCPPVNLGLYKIELSKYEKSGGYQRDLAVVASRARDYIARQTERRGKLALVLDIDETALSNWPAMVADDLGLIPIGPCNLSDDGLPKGACGWLDWIKQARDRPIAPTLELYRQARQQGWAVFFITGRPEFLRSATERNLRAAGYDKWDGLMMPSNQLLMHHALKSLADFKTPQRRKIVAQGYTIIVNVGDQDSDLEGGYAERTFKLPNPFYYIP
jgi:predicted secreted acid phosphatase